MLWEYCEVEIDPSGQSCVVFSSEQAEDYEVGDAGQAIELLDLLGAAGWELVSVHRRWHDGNTMVYTMKRHRQP